MQDGSIATPAQLSQLVPLSYRKFENYTTSNSANNINTTNLTTHNETQLIEKGLNESIQKSKIINSILNATLQTFEHSDNKSFVSQMNTTEGTISIIADNEHETTVEFIPPHDLMSNLIGAGIKTHPESTRMAHDGSFLVSDSSEHISISMPLLLQSLVEEAMKNGEVEIEISNPDGFIDI